MALPGQFVPPSNEIPSRSMRVRIIKEMTGEVDGIDLRCFKRGQVYDLPASLGTYLMVSGWATAVVDTSPALIVPLDEIESVALGDRIRQKAVERRRR
jgi:hypothetical protein